MAEARENNSKLSNFEMDSDSEDGWESCEKEEDYVVNTMCLFCDEMFDSPEKCWEHIRTVHNFDISSAKIKSHLDCFSYIKMINFCRMNEMSVEELMNVEKQMWQDDKYLMPALENDGLLQYDIESVGEGTGEHDRVPEDQVEVSRNVCLGSETERQGYMNGSSTEDLKFALKKANEDIETMRSFVQNLVPDVSSYANSSSLAVKNLRVDEDSAYINSYGHFGIHQEMLRDKVRTNFYKDCMFQNKEVFQDKIVLDIGCGTGILSMFAAQCGAKQVIGVEMSDIIYQAMDIIRENGFQDKITLLKGRMEDVELPVTKVDIIISEWMGYFLLFESMLDTVLWARDHYLSSNGCILPDSCSIDLIGVADQTLYMDNVKYWDDVYGFKMSSMRTALLEEASVMKVNPESRFTKPCILKSIDIGSTCLEDLEFESPFVLNTDSDLDITALVGYFDVSWSCATEKMTMSTSPFSPETHWKQTVFLLPDPVNLKAGIPKEGSLICKKNRKDPRSLIVVISFDGKILRYRLQ